MSDKDPGSKGSAAGTSNVPATSAQGNPEGTPPPAPLPPASSWDLSNEPADESQTPAEWKEATPPIRTKTIEDTRNGITAVLMALLVVAVLAALADALWLHPDSRNVRDIVTTLVALVGPVIGFYYAKHKLR